MDSTNLLKLKKRTLYILGSLFALIASYIFMNESYSVSLNTDIGMPSTAHADIPSSGDADSGGDDCGDSGDDCF